MKATHYGTCQICGNKQKAPDGVLSLHGYTVDNGWFNGICHGAKELPFEQDRSVLGDVIVQFEDHINSKQKYLEDVINGVEDYKVMLRTRSGFASSKKHWVNFVIGGYDPKTNTDSFLIDATGIVDEFNKLERFNNEYNVEENGMIRFTPKYYSDECPRQKEIYVSMLKRQINSMKSQLINLKERYNNWELKELELV